MNELGLEESCDGIHDDGAPAHYLCTRCFPDQIEHAHKGDLSQIESDDYDEVPRDEQQEVE